MKIDRQDPDPLDPKAGAEILGLDVLETQPDDSELQEINSTSPTNDSPGDAAILEQEELYEGISSESRPSGKIKEG